MIAQSASTWAEWNQSVLLAEFASLRQRLGETAQDSIDYPENETEQSEAPSAIDALTAAFHLSAFERELLLLCAGVEMNPALRELCEQQSGNSKRGCVTFGLGMAVLAGPHWSALAPSAPLRRFRLIEMESGYGLTAAPLRIDERILHYLAGVNRLDERLAAVLHRKPAGTGLAQEHCEIFNTTLADIETQPQAEVALQFYGDDPQGQESLAAALAQQAGVALFVLRMEDTPNPGAEMEQFLALWARESVLLPGFLLLQWENETPTPAARQLAKRLGAPLLLAAREPVLLPRLMRQMEINKPAPAGQRELWHTALGAAGESLNGHLDPLAGQFRLSAETIFALGNNAAAHDHKNGEELSDRLWSACRDVSRPRLESLAQRIVPSAGWDDLVLPPFEMQLLRQLATQSRHRLKVYEDWGFAARGRRGLGMSALFCGPSGTGKTLAAEVLARDLQLDLYRVDLSGVVSKYIGETEKNLKQVFDVAETGGAMLLFDEADAIFGKRAEVKDSHDRYANIEVGYLLQRMETFEGLAVLTTNMKSSLDRSFQRRLRFTVDFPFPDAAHRRAIWARAFPKQTPTEGLNPALLANLSMSGGSIRNIALNAAFLAADQNSPVRMAHILTAAQLEAVKVERPLSEAETRGWV